MTETVRSQRQERARLIAELRRAGRTWIDIAGDFAQRYRVNMRVAFRWAHDWSQRRAAEEWNARWPDEPKTLKSFSYWELWPSPTGHEPSLDVLDKLAQLYECSVPDLLGDRADYRHLDAAGSAAHGGALVLPGGPTVPAPDVATGLAAPISELVVPGDIVTLLMQHFGSTLIPSGGGQPATARERDIAFDQLVKFFTSWARSMKRREVLRILGWAATAAAAAPVFHGLDPEEQERVASVLDNPCRIDEQTIRHLEAVLWRCKRQDDALGPQTALETVLAQRNLARALLPECVPTLRSRLLSVLSNASRQAGWLSFDLNDFDSAWYYYEDARALAHEAEDTELGAYVLCTAAGAGIWCSPTPATQRNSRPFIRCMVAAEICSSPAARRPRETAAMPAEASLVTASSTSAPDRAATPIWPGSTPSPREEQVVPAGRDRGAEHPPLPRAEVLRLVQVTLLLPGRQEDRIPTTPDLAARH